MIGNTVFKTWRAIIASLLMELARVPNLKPTIEKIQTSKEQQLGHQTSKEQQCGHQTSKEQQLGHQISKEQQLRHQNANTSTEHLGIPDLDENHLHQEPNTPEENHQVPKT